MVSLQIEIPDEFLKEEVRQGYTVTEKMKKVWAVQLDLVHKLDTVCKKYGLRYFADSGTLLGAVRDKGFIPWDDDIDIVMLRRDYELLKKVADKEFRHPYFYQDMYRDEGLIRPHAQLRNSETTAYLPQEKNRPYNKGIFVDIFPLDILPDDEKTRKIHLAVDDAELAKRRAAQDKAGWKPMEVRKRRVTTALKAYAAFATSAAEGAVRRVPD